MKKAKKMRGGGATMSVSPRKKMAMGMMLVLFCLVYPNIHLD